MNEVKAHQEIWKALDEIKEIVDDLKNKETAVTIFQSAGVIKSQIKDLRKTSSVECLEFLDKMEEHADEIQKVADKYIKGE